MRTIALAAVIGVGLTVGGVALAGPFADNQGRINFNSPFSGMDPPTQTATQTTVLTFDGGHDCFVIGRNNAVTAGHPAADVIYSTRNAIAADAWVATANAVRDFFPQRNATLTSQSVDTTGVWPVQRAEFSGSANGPVFAAMQSRPGVDLMAFCQARDGASAAPFEQLFASLAHPNDTTWQAEAAQAAAARAAAVEQAAQQAATQQAQQPQQGAQDAEDDDGGRDNSRPSRDPRSRRN